MTEDEAKTKWCPFVVGDSVPANDPHRGHYAKGDDFAINTNCIASACMAWRWLDKREMRWTGLNNPPDGEGWERVENLNGPGYWLRFEQTPTGRCGLAGSA